MTVAHVKKAPLMVWDPLIMDLWMLQLATTVFQQLVANWKLWIPMIAHGMSWILQTSRLTNLQLLSHVP